MKRSQINFCIHEAGNFPAQTQFTLPPFIRGEGLIPQSPLRGITSGRIFSVLNPRPIPYKNNIPRPFRAGLLIHWTPGGWEKPYRLPAGGNKKYLL